MIKNIIKQAKQKIQKLDIEYYYIIFIAMFILMPLISKNTVITISSKMLLPSPIRKVEIYIWE